MKTNHVALMSLVMVINTFGANAFAEKTACTKQILAALGQAYPNCEVRADSIKLKIGQTQTMSGTADLACLAGGHSLTASFLVSPAPGCQVDVVE